MLGFEVIGLVSNLASALVSCLDIYQRFSECQEHGKQVHRYISKVHIEHIRLLLWAQSVGLIHFDHFPRQPRNIYLDIPVIHDAIESALVMMKRSFDESKDLIKKYAPPLKSSHSSSRLNPLVATQAPIRRRLPPYFDTIGRQERQLQIEEKTQKEASWKKKFGWALAGDEKKFKSLVEDLRNTNNSLQTMILTPDGATNLDRYFQSMAIFETSEPSGLNLLQEAASGTYEQLAAVAAVRSWPQNHIVSNAVLRLDLQCLVDAPTRPGNSSTVTRYRYQQKQPNRNASEVAVLVEWKPYKEDRNKPEENEKMDTRVHDIARLLHETTQKAGLQTLNCMGYLKDHDKTRYGFVYQFPPGADTSTATSLLDRITEDYNQKYRVSLSERFRIASKIAQAVHQVLVSEWLHKSIRSENFFGFDAETTSGPRATSVSSPSVTAGARWAISPFLTGFAFARPDDPAEDSEKPGLHWDHDRYRHPDYLRNPGYRYQKLYDIYSLGVVLLEIAYWTTARAMFTSKQDVSAFQAFIVREDRMDDLRYRVGGVYQKVVERCLKGDFLLPDSDNENEKSLMLLNAFQTQVVAELEKCQA